MLMIDPRPRSHIPGATRRISRNALFRLTSIILSNWASSIESAGPCATLVAALLTRISTRPKRDVQRVGQALEVVRAADVAGDGDGSFADLARHGVERLLLASADGDGGAFADKGLSNGFPDSAASAGDQGDPIFESPQMSCNTAPPLPPTDSTDSRGPRKFCPQIGQGRRNGLRH